MAPDPPRHGEGVHGSRPTQARQGCPWLQTQARLGCQWLHTRPGTARVSMAPDPPRHGWVSRWQSRQLICHIWKPHTACELHALCFIELQLLPIKVLHCRDRDFGPFLLLWPWTWPDDLHTWTWSVYTPRILKVQKWTSYVKAYKSHRITSRKCVHLVTCGHFQSRDKDGSHIIQSAVAGNPMIQTSQLYVL